MRSTTDLDLQSPARRHRHHAARRWQRDDLDARLAPASTGAAHRGQSRAVPRVRDARPDDAAAITALANALIPSTTYTWTERLEPVAERAAWVDARQSAGLPVVVAVEPDDDADVLGWASFGDFRDTERTPGYLITAELTIHVREDRWGRGVGRALMAALEDRARAAGKKVLVAGIDASNERSIEFHRRLGFVETARMPGVGELRGERLDLVLLQRDVGADR
ncbi:GNAT family N-acetyltransferase [Dermatobacter hominis]|uniref:GNAT family N-acetyltransferase n=1 Tax=Dermatobacter hominis TaxID=2884263 RepID=UPI001D1166C2|nr:GNAT family N-acetyltransferase [Dermatobacter hominis]UDY35092.1 N-acetyltransferase family protein [Dermatobacter hominis]